MEKMNKTFAGESFFTVGGQLDVTSIDPLTVAFIGGSLYMRIYFLGMGMESTSWI